MRRSCCRRLSPTRRDSRRLQVARRSRRVGLELPMLVPARRRGVLARAHCIRTILVGPRGVQGGRWEEGGRVRAPPLWGAREEIGSLRWPTDACSGAGTHGGRGRRIQRGADCGLRSCARRAALAGAIRPRSRPSTGASLASAVTASSVDELRAWTVRPLCVELPGGEQRVVWGTSTRPRALRHDPLVTHGLRTAEGHAPQGRQPPRPQAHAEEALRGQAARPEGHRHEHMPGIRRTRAGHLHRDQRAMEKARCSRRAQAAPRHDGRIGHTPRAGEARGDRPAESARGAVDRACEGRSRRPARAHRAETTRRARLRTRAARTRAEGRERPSTSSSTGFR